MSEWAAHGEVNWLPENHMAIFDFRSLFRQLNWQPLNSSEQVVNAQNSQLRMDVMKSLAYSFTTCEKCGHGPFNCPHSKRDRNNTFAFNSNRLQWNHSTRFIAVRSATYTQSLLECVIRSIDKVQRSMWILLDFSVLRPSAGRSFEVYSNCIFHQMKPLTVVWFYNNNFNWNSNPYSVAMQQRTPLNCIYCSPR